MKSAAILKSNGSDGELLVSLGSFDFEDLKDKEPVLIEFDGLPVPFFISQANPRGNSKALVRFVDIESGADAEELVGRRFYRQDADDDAEESLEDFIGWTVELSDGRSFEITAVEDIPGNPCIELGGSALVPLHEDFVEGIDPDQRIITLNLPEGLI